MSPRAQADDMLHDAVSGVSYSQDRPARIEYNYDCSCGHHNKGWVNEDEGAIGHKCCICGKTTLV